MRLFWLRERTRTSLWFVPAACVLFSILLALLLGLVDRHVEAGWLNEVTFKGDADNAQTFLTTISTSMITFTGLVFTITIVVLQLASQQLSPRILRIFLRDRMSQLSLGVFVGTFTYSMFVLRGLRPGEDMATVPNISITAGFGLVLLSIGFFVAYIHHISQSIRIGYLAEALALETDEAIAEIYDHPEPPEPVQTPSSPPVQVLTAGGRGVLAAMDRDSLVEVARRHGAVIKVLPALGDFVPSGSPVLQVFGERVPEDTKEHLALARERTMAQDPAFGFRQLVDIGQKALSPAVNDPTTAVQSIDVMHDLLRKLATLPFPHGQRSDADGELRLIFPVMTWEAYVHLACDELRHYGVGSLQVIRRLRGMLEDLLEVAPVKRRPVIEKQLTLLASALTREWPDVEERKLGSIGDAQGLGD